MVFKLSHRESEAASRVLNIEMKMQDQQIPGIKGMIATMVTYLIASITLSDAAMVATILVGLSAAAVNIQKFIHNHQNKKK